MNTIIQYLQIASAVYILIIAAVCVCIIITAIVTGRPPDKTNLSGYPALLAVVATIVCAVSTLVLLS